MSPAERTPDKNTYGLVRLVDHLAGALLLSFLGLVRQSRPLPAKAIESILLMKFDGLGDLVLVTGIGNDLRARYPQAKINLLCGPFNLPLARLLACFDRCVCLSLNAPWRTLQEIRALDVDICIDLGEWSRIEAVLARLSGADFTIGFRTRGQHRHYAYDQHEDLRTDRHELENYRALLRRLAIQTGAAPSLDLRPVPRMEFTPNLPPNGRYAILHLWSGSATWAHLKELPVDRWVAVVDWLTKRGIPVYVTGSQGEQARFDAFATHCRQQGLTVLPAIGFDFRDLLEFLRRAALVVSIDTSIAHLGGALGVPTVTIFGPTSSKRWGPIGPKVLAIDSPVPGCGYMNWGADSDHSRARLKCTEAITTEQVISALATFVYDLPAAPNLLSVANDVS